MSDGTRRTGRANPHSRNVLQLRLDHPEASLVELGAMNDPPLSKDTVAGILRRAKGDSA
jgi:DNA-binding transcriptional regulator WhiA